MKKNKWTFTVKDNFCLNNSAITTASSFFLTNFKSGWNSFVVNLLLEQKFNLQGKTVLDELSCGGTGLLANTGILHNPYKKDRIVGGSSSGSSLSIVEKNISFSIGSDTGGSIVVPSSYCGIIGFKPLTIPWSQTKCLAVRPLFVFILNK